MERYNIPESWGAFLFDMDGTLYTNRAYMQFQIHSSIERLARLRGTSFEAMQGAITAYQETWAQTHQGQRVSLGNTLVHFGVSIKESIRWREELYEPEVYLKADPKLRETLKRLGATHVLAVVTNNPVLVARKPLAALGVEDRFQGIVGLDTCLVSKPHAAPFLKAVELCGVSPWACVSVGDRYDIDIALPLTLGMGGILVAGVEDVYQLGCEEDSMCFSSLETLSRLGRCITRW
ncbi:MAG: HAD family hydrolase [Treponema sp.]|jgi:phosphoglycolate phosphatase/putative hydrolase of the HAD superfamily|nr:HAD family hydrolase [Treponema sp.]